MGNLFTIQQRGVGYFNFGGCRDSSLLPQVTHIVVLAGPRVVRPQHKGSIGKDRTFCCGQGFRNC